MAAKVARKPPAVRDRRNLPKAKIVPMAKKSKIMAAPPTVVVLPPDSDMSLVGDDILKIEDIPFIEEDISEISDSEDSDFRDESDVEITYEDMEVQGVSAFVPKLSNGHNIADSDICSRPRDICSRPRVMSTQLGEVLTTFER